MIQKFFAMGQPESGNMEQGEVMKQGPDVTVEKTRVLTDNFLNKAKDGAFTGAEIASVMTEEQLVQLKNETAPVLANLTEELKQYMV